MPCWNCGVLACLQKLSESFFRKATCSMCFPHVLNFHAHLPRKVHLLQPTRRDRSRLKSAAKWGGKMTCSCRACALQANPPEFATVESVLGLTSSSCHSGHYHLNSDPTGCCCCRRCCCCCFCCCCRSHRCRRCRSFFLLEALSSFKAQGVLPRTQTLLHMRRHRGYPEVFATV